MQLLFGDRSRFARMGRATSARVGSVAAAIRIPERARLSLVLPGSPQLFVHEGARQSLERKFMAAFSGAVVLSITDNRHSIITHRRVRGVLHARIHHMFLAAPPSVVDALVRYMMTGDRDASAVVGYFIEENAHRLAPRSRKLKLHTRGENHDLLAIFDELNERYFDGAVHAVLTWGKRGRSRRASPRTTIKLGSYSAGERIIRIHPSLDRTWVPRYFVRYIVYHEMLHNLVPPARVGMRTLLHPPEFALRERQFRQFERAIAWERAHIARLLRS
jgi:hypothetical protein